MAALTLHDGTRLYLETGPDVPSAISQVLLVHGLGEHVGRYADLIRRLTQAGLHVTAYDQRGHGQSEGPRGGMPADDTLLRDLAAVIDHLRCGQAHSLPLVLLGHSMGGALAARFVAEGFAASPADWFRPIQGLVLSSPALAADLSPVQHLLLALGRLRPDGPASNGLNPAWISRDVQVVRNYVADPLVHNRITPRLARFILAAGDRVLADAGRWNVPTLLLYAQADRCVAPRGSAAFAAAAPNNMLTTQAFEGLHHEIFNEPEKDMVIARLMAWLATQGHVAVERL